MTYRESLAYLKSLNPLGIRLGLDPVLSLLERLGNPQDGSPAVLIAGTNGKGSVAALTAAMLTAAGFRTGLYTSPDLIDFRERIRIDGRMIRCREIVSAVESVKSGVRETVSYFEFLTAMAFLHFRREKADISVLEVGLGGRLDATNVVTPLVSVITNISLEHRDYLGNTLQKIACEKGGIIKERGICITAARQRAVIETLEGICRERGATLYRVGKEIRVMVHQDGTFSYLGLERSLKRLVCPFIGRHQISNAALALGAVELIGDAGFRVGDAAVSKGLKQVQWEGRLEILRRSPMLLVDGAHNPAGVTVLCRALQKDLPHRRLILLFGVLGDKDYRTMARRLFPLADRVILTRPDCERAVPPDSLRPLAEKYNRAIEVVEDPGNALARALSLAGKDDLVCAAGSLYLVGEIKRRHRILQGQKTGFALRESGDRDGVERG